MKKLISLSLMLSLGLATISPAVQAAQTQTMRQRIAGAMPNMPAWTKSPGFEAAKKWWRAGRNMNVLSPQEQKAFNALKTKVGITAVITAIMALLGTAAYIMASQQQKKQRREKTGEIIGGLAREVQERQIEKAARLAKIQAAKQQYFEEPKEDWTRLEKALDTHLPPKEKDKFNTFVEKEFVPFEPINGESYFKHRLTVLRLATQNPGYFESKISHFPETFFDNKTPYRNALKEYNEPNLPDYPKTKAVGKN